MSKTLATLALALLLALSTPSQLTAQVLAEGEVDLFFSTGPGSPNFNSPITQMHTVPADIGPTAGRLLVLSLRDSSRPEQFCDPEDPTGGLFEGCAVVDWPFAGRRGINLVELELDEGSRTFHLRMSDEFDDEPEPEGP